MSFNPETSSAIPVLQSLRYLHDSSSQPIAVVESRNQILRYVNPAFCTLIGVEAVQLLGQPFISAMLGTDGVGCRELLTRVFESGTTEAVTLQRESKPAPLHWTYLVWVVRSIEGVTVGLIIQVTDVTLETGINEALIKSSLKQHELTEIADKLNVQLEAANQAKNLFLAVMSHEIRTPLNVIMGAAEMLCLPGLLIEERRDYEARIKRNVILLARLIEDILDLTKIEAGMVDIVKVETQFEELLADVATHMRQAAEAKGLSFFLKELSPLPQMLFTDPIRLRQILINIVGNAIKFTATGSVSVALKAEHEDNKLHVLVSDTGKGITAEEAAMIFNPFTQTDASYTRLYGGTGLGLDLARRLAKALGGNVVLIKSKPGEGSVFEITVALEGVSYKPLAGSVLQAHPELSKLEGVHVLLAEDSPDNQFLVKKYLTQVGAAVDIANDGEEAVAMAQAGDYDLVLMDRSMPKLDGYAATAQLRSAGYLKPIIALTAHAMQGEAERSHRAGCSAYVSKPVKMNDLIELVYCNSRK